MLTAPEGTDIWDQNDPEMVAIQMCIRDRIEDMIAGSQPDREAEEQAARLTLGERFLIPPFTVLDSRGGVWAERKNCLLYTSRCV